MLDTTLDKTLPSHLSMAPISERAREEYGRSRQRAPKILVVDDKVDTLLLLRELLSSRGYDIITATEAEEAKHMVNTERPELILLDVGMPRLNGLDATRRIREQPWGRGLAIVALTGWGQENDRERSREAGCDGHLVKPVGLAELQRMVADVRSAKG